MKRKTEADKKMAEIMEAIRQHQDQLSALEQARSSPDNQMEAQCLQLAESEHLTSELARAFIKAIFVYGPDQIEIEWRFKDVFQTA